MSIIRIGLAETKNFSDGYDLIFGKKNEPKQAEQPEAKKDEEKKDKKPKKGKK